MDEGSPTIIDHGLSGRIGSGLVPFAVDVLSNVTFDDVPRLIPAANRSLTHHSPAAQLAAPWSL